MSERNAVPALLDIPAEAYRLPEDGKGWKNKCANRRMLAIQFLSYTLDTDPPGAAKVDLNTILKHTGLDSDSFHEILHELTMLGILNGMVYVNVGPHRGDGNVMFRIKPNGWRPKYIFPEPSAQMPDLERERTRERTHQASIHYKMNVRTQELEREVNKLHVRIDGGVAIVADIERGQTSLEKRLAAIERALATTMAKAVEKGSTFAYCADVNAFLEGDTVKKMLEESRLHKANSVSDQLPEPQKAECPY